MKELPFWDHIGALRASLLRILITIFSAFCLCLVFYDTILKILLIPIKEHSDIILITPLEGMTCAFKVCFWCALMVASPVCFYFLFCFISPALRYNEKRVAFLFALLAFGAMVGMLFFGYYLSLPLACKLLLSFNSSFGTNAWTLTHVLNFALGLLLIHVFVGEFVLLGFLLVHLHILTTYMLIKARRYMVVAIFIISAIVTPPDLLSQLLMAFPLMLFYEAIILYSRLRQKTLAYNIKR